MNFIELLLIAIGLSMDCFAVSLSFGAQKKLNRNDILKFSFFFAFFQALMPVIGWMVGNAVNIYLSDVDHWIAFGILAAIGLRMIYEAFGSEDKKRSVDIREWKILLTLSLATSIDALITGVSFGFIKVNILLAVITIALITFLNSVAGAYVGKRSIHISPKGAEIIGGLVLIGIGVKIVLQHLSII
ncbi:MAG: manganese efflux pump MntP family protein [Bacteroidetes bacterium]|nr:manganese efflux pump MntP family protein [Bacteroidota bacterium]